MNNLLLFEDRVADIRRTADEIAGTTFIFEKLHNNPIISSKYDLHRSARNLREAADKLDSIANRSKDNAV